jgi:hypothetical protein
MDFIMHYTFFFHTPAKRTKKIISQDVAQARCGGASGYGAAAFTRAAGRLGIGGSISAILELTLGAPLAAAVAECVEGCDK